MDMESVTWRGTWIRPDWCGGKSTGAPVACLRRGFELARAPRRALLHITALGLYEAEINGRAVGDHALAPGWTAYHQRVAFQSHDVTDLLTAGANAIGVWLSDGWYCGYIATHPRQTYGDRPELLCQLELEWEEGSSQIIASGPDWRHLPGPILTADLLQGEDYDERLEHGDWSSPGYDDSAWRPVLAGGPHPIAIVRSPAPPVRRIESLPAVAVTLRGRPGQAARERVYDFGQNLSGRVRIRFEAPAGTHLTLRHAEMLNPDGSLYTANLRSARATDHYTCARDGWHEWEPKFTFHGFRYAGVDGLPTAAACEISAVVLHNDMARAGRFACSHPLLNQLAHNILWGLKGNFLEIPTDCPQRDERLGWTGDAQVFILTATYLMDVRGFFDKWLLDMRDAQGPAGEIPPTIPFTRPFELPPDGNSAWADAVVICPWILYLRYGDARVLADHYACMRGYMDYLATHKVKDHIRGHPDVDSWGGFGDWLALDGSGKTDGGTPKDLIGTAMYANNAELLARIAGILGKPEEGRHWRELHAAIVAAFRRRFVTPEGLLAAATQTGYVLALQFELLPEDARPAAARELARDIEGRGTRLATGFVGTPYLLDVLERHGHLDLAYRLLEREEFPSWLFPVKHGATTIWERWDGWTPDNGFQDPGMNSFNHYAYGAVGAWMFQSVAGIGLDEDAPGCERILFRPRPGGTLTWAEAAIETARGPASIRWELEEPGRLRVDLTVPAAATAVFSPPPGWTPAEDLPDSLQPGAHRLILRR
jgi:alpha-L-rhamnosidase